MLKIKIFTRIVPRSWIATVAVYISVVVDSLYERCVSRVLREVEKEGYVLSADIIKKQCKVKTILYIQFAKYGTQVCFDSAFGYFKFARDYFVITPEMNHLCYL
jgi:hypothetical protein